MLREKKTKPEVPRAKAVSGSGKRKSSPSATTRPPPRRVSSSTPPPPSSPRKETFTSTATTVPAPKKGHVEGESVRPARQRAPSFADVDQVTADLSKDPRRDG
jgi:hypothetical protein